MTYIADMKDELIVVRNTESAVKFTKTIGAFGWLNPKGDDSALKCWVVTGGLAQDNRIFYLDEYGGKLAATARAAIDAKDRLFVSAFYADDTDRIAIREIRNEDGLTHYETLGKDIIDKPKYVNKPEHWPNFRSRTYEDGSPRCASVIPVRDDDRVDIIGGLDRLAHSLEKETAVITIECPGLLRALREDLDVAIEHPLIKAAVWVHSALLRAQEKPAEKSDTPTRGYWNLRR